MVVKVLLWFNLLLLLLLLLPDLARWVCVEKAAVRETGKTENSRLLKVRSKCYEGNHLDR